MTASLHEFLDGLTVASVATTLVDVALVYYLIYRLLLTIRGTRAAQMVVGIVLVGAAFFIAERLAQLPSAARERAWVDPGLGFGKGADPEVNLTLLRHSGELGARLGRPVVIGASRKRFVRRAFGVQDGDLPALDAASVTATLDAVAAGANVVRVHNVALLRAGLALYTKQ